MFSNLRIGARLAIGFGLIAWVVALVLLFAGLIPTTSALEPATAIVGLALGLFGWFWVGRRR